MPTTKHDLSPTRITLLAASAAYRADPTPAAASAMAAARAAYDAAYPAITPAEASTRPPSRRLPWRVLP